jgi:acyl carrier protein
MSTCIREDLLAKVKRIIATSLAIAEADITLESRLSDDLGADSLDFVDMVFLLDRELGIQVRETEFNFLTRLDFTSPEVMKDGFLTHDVVERLATWLPAIATTPDRTRITPRQLFSLITVESICIVVQRWLDRVG